MKIKCKYCDSFIDDTNTNCPNCGAALDGVVRFANKQPQTIEELQKWYVAMKLPPEQVTRFFIGKDVKEPRAFGIYRDAGGDFVVYKNKTDGSRAVRYRGFDEAYAVNEIYQRLREEIVNQKSHNADRRMQQAQNAARASQGGQTKEWGASKHKTTRKRRRSNLLTVVCMIGMIYVLAGTMATGAVIQSRNAGSVSRPATGYYSYDGTDYYHQGNDWYYYDESEDDWGHTVAENIPEAVANDIEGQYHTYGHEGLPFEDTFWYQEPSTSTYNDYDNDYDRYDSYDNDSYDWDDDYGWDSDDSWDSYDSDWDSDW